MKVPVVIPTPVCAGHVYSIHAESFAPNSLPTKDQWLWLSGGGALVLNGRYALLVERSATAPTNPLKLTLATGRADTLEECLEPERTVRECFEEVQILWRGQRVCPVIQPDYLVQSAIACGQKIHSSAKIINVKAHEIKFNNQVVQIYKQKQLLSETTGYWHFNSSTREIHLLRLYNLEFKDFNKDDFVFFDTELDPNGVVLNRNIFLYDVKNNKILDSHFAVQNFALSNEQQFTPHANDFLLAWYNHVNQEL